jgi:surface protein
MATLGISASNENKYNLNVTLYNLSLPREMIDMISDFVSIKGVFTPLSREELREAIHMYVHSYEEAITMYGEIGMWDVSNITSMKGLFLHKYLTNRRYGGISKWNVSNVTDMSDMFKFSMLNVDISKWDVSKVKNMSEMFFHSTFNSDLSRWNVSNVTNMSKMFNYAIFPGDIFAGDISTWDVSNVTDMSEMFMGSYSFVNISNWDVSNVTNMTNMFGIIGFSPFRDNSDDRF